MSHRDQQLIKEARKGNTLRAIRLIGDGADVNSRGKYGYTALMEAASHDHVEMVRQLLDFGADPLSGADDNAPPTFFACVHGFTEVVKILLNSGADPNALRDSDFDVRDGDSRGISQLGIAIRHGYSDIALALIDAGANVDHVHHGQMLIEIALEARMDAVVERIREVDRSRRHSRQIELAEQDAEPDL